MKILFINFLKMIVRFWLTSPTFFAYFSRSFSTHNFLIMAISSTACVLTSSPPCQMLSSRHLKKFLLAYFIKPLSLSNLTNGHSGKSPVTMQMPIPSLSRKLGFLCAVEFYSPTGARRTRILLATELTVGFCVLSRGFAESARKNLKQ